MVFPARQTMLWDFRNLIRRGGGRWPRDWRDRNRDPIRPPERRAEPGDRRTGGGERERDERWLEPRWQPPPGTVDDWKK